MIRAWRRCSALVGGAVTAGIVRHDGCTSRIAVAGGALCLEGYARGSRSRLLLLGLHAPPSEALSSSSCQEEDLSRSKLVVTALRRPTAHQQRRPACLPPACCHAYILFPVAVKLLLPDRSTTTT